MQITRREALCSVGLAVAYALTQTASGGVGAIGRATGAVSSGGPGYFAAGHWVSSPVASFDPTNQTATQIYPRPDSETASWARHHWLYYDGVNAFKNIIPICLRGGAFPYIYEIIEAPANAGASMGASIWQAGWTIAEAIAAGYGDLWLEPTGTITNGTITVRVYDQTGAYNDVSFTVSTVAGYQFNATTPADSYGFIFLDPVNGTDPSSYPSTTGLVSTIGSPIKTALWAYGATPTTQTYPNAILVAMAGTVPVFAQNSQYGIEPTVNYGPQALINYPGESVNIDMTNAPTVNGAMSSAFYINGSDTFYQGLNMTGGPSGSTNFSVFIGLFQHHRLTLHNISQPNAWSGTAPVSNASMLSLLETNTKNYIWMKGCSESNRTDSAGGTGTESMALFVWGQVQYGGAELCTATGCASYGPWWKWACGDVTFRCSEVVMNTSYKYAPIAADVPGDIPNPPVMQNQEVCYCILDGYANGTGIGLLWNQYQGSNGDLIGLTVSYRNSINGFINMWKASTNNGPIESINDAINYGPGNQAMMAERTVGPLPSNMSTTGTECQAATGVFNNPSGGDYSLAGSYASYTGLRGATIQ